MKTKLFLSAIALSIVGWCYAATSYTLTLYADGCESANVFTCNVGQQVNIVAVPNDQQRFVQWNDGNTDNPRLVTVSQNTTFTAEFAPIPTSCTLTLYADGCESANVFTCDVGLQVNIVAIPNAQRRFIQWNDGNTDNPRLVTVSQDMTLTAEFVSATPTAVEQTQDYQDNSQNVTIQKIIRNGQVLIQKGDNIYTVTGQEVNE